MDRYLANAQDQQAYRIVRILTRQTDRLEYLAALGLTPGVWLYILHKAPFHGPIQLKLETEYRIVGYELARSLTLVAAAP
jgi:Fe2+ transport system protein FeoA